MENKSDFSYKGRAECKQFLERAYNYLLKEMDSNKRIPFDLQAYDYIQGLSFELDLYL